MLRDYFFQLVLFLAGVVSGIVVPLLPKKGQKWVAGILAVLLIVISFVWAGYEIGVREISPELGVPPTLILLANYF